MGVFLDLDGKPRLGNSTSNNSGYTLVLIDGTVDHSNFVYTCRSWLVCGCYYNYTLTSCVFYLPDVMVLRLTIFRFVLLCIRNIFIEIFNNLIKSIHKLKNMCYINYVKSKD